MSIELLSIGNELLSGRTPNSNATWIASLLRSQGYLLSRVTVLPDQIAPLQEGIQEAWQRSSFLLTTGGLGPTGDDRTLEAVARAFHLPLVIQEDVKKELTLRLGADFPFLDRQSMAPQGAKVLPNLIGTAPGYLLEREGKALFIFPGVPAQMEELVRRELLPYLAKRRACRKFCKELFFSPMDETTVDPLLRTLEKENPSLEIGICPSYDALSVYLSVEAEGQEQAEEILLPIQERIVASFPSSFFSSHSRKVELALHHLLLERGYTLALAESCTGGSIAARIVSLSGASSYFLGAVVAYSNELKSSLLFVSLDTLRKEGAVSQAAAEEMARGVLALTQADFAISVSGIAGPLGGTQQKPVGTIWGAIATKRGEMFSGKLPTLQGVRRDLLIEYAGSYLLFQLYRYLTHQIPPFIACI